MLRWLAYTLFFGLALAQTDRTVEDRATGGHVVDAVVDKIQKSCIFSNDKMLLKRIALVESTNGLGSKTFRSNYHGGIWQVDEESFKNTQISSVSSFFSKIKTEFNIDWASATWNDLTKPLFSGLAARLRIQVLGGDIPWSITDQATYWKDRYTTNSDAVSELEFKTKVEGYETVCNIPNADLFFVLDSSGSIGSSNFDTMKDFVENMVNSFTISSSAVRVGVITYSDNSKVEFSLQKYSAKSDIVSAVRAISYRSGGTYTSKGLDELRVQMENYARPASSGVPRVAIVLTDGKSNSLSKTTTAAEKVHADDVIMFAVGVTPNTNQLELNAIGSDPDCLHVFNLVQFSDIPHFKNEIARRSCRVSAIVDIGVSISGSLVYGQAKYFSVKIKITVGITLKVKVTTGVAVVYASYSIRNPSAAYFDYKMEVQSSFGYASALYIPPSSFMSGRKKRATEESETAYIAVEGAEKDKTNTFELDTLSGNHSGSGNVIMSLTLTFVCLLVVLAQ